MKTRLLHIWELLTTSYWFLPSLLVLMASVSSLLLMELDERWGKELVRNLGWLDRMSPEGVRVLLGTVAASSLTLMAISFSATIVSLTMAASQFGPRLLRNFMRSATNQVTLGLLLATFVFSLLVLRHVRGDPEMFIPHFSTFGVFLLMLVSLGFFIVFIHRLSTSIQAEQVVADVLCELEALIDEVFPEEESDSERRDPERCPPDDGGSTATVRYVGERSGYLQAVNREELVELARDRRMFIDVTARPGDFVLTKESIATVRMEDQSDAGDALNKKISMAFLLGDHRTPEQDALYGIRQLVEVALRALSPGINDPFTAIHCIHGLSVALSKMMSRPGPRECLTDANGSPRVSLKHHSFADIVDATYSLLRPSARERPEIALAIVESLARVASICPANERVTVLREEATRIVERLDVDGFAELDSKRLKNAIQSLELDSTLLPSLQ